MKSIITPTGYENVASPYESSGGELGEKTWRRRGAQKEHESASEQTVSDHHPFIHRSLLSRVHYPGLNDAELMCL